MDNLMNLTKVLLLIKTSLKIILPFFMLSIMVQANAFANVPSGPIILSCIRTLVPGEVRKRCIHLICFKIKQA